MSDSKGLLERVAGLGARIDPGLSDRDVDRLIEGSHRRRRRRTAVRLGLATAAAGVCALVVAHLGGQPAGSPPGEIAALPKLPSAGGQLSAQNGSGDPTGAAAARPRAQATPTRALPSPGVAPVAPASRPPLRLADGSMATPLDGGSVVAVVEDSPRRVALDLQRGRGRFEVVPRPERSFSVRAGDVTVTVLGTIFTVERVADRIGVTVERGTVRIDWGVGTQRLHVGESGWFPPLQVGKNAEPRGPRPLPAPAPVVAVAGQPPDPRTVPPPASFAPAAAPTAEQLLSAADSARLQGRAEEGAALLRRLLQDHAGDARAPLAAFTLGRLLLMELGRPREAAAMFAEVRALAPGGPFAEDALAREAEAWTKAGEPEKARAAGREYLRAYPHGRRAAAVRKLDGIE